MEEQISLQKDDTQAALDALGSLQSSLKDALHSLLVSHCAGYMSSTEYGIKRSSIEGHISNCEIIRAALTAQQPEKPYIVDGDGALSQTKDVNAELLEALKRCVKALDGGATDAEANIAMIRGYEAIAIAEQKGK